MDVLHGLSDPNNTLIRTARREDVNQYYTNMLVILGRNTRSSRRVSS